MRKWGEFTDFYSSEHSARYYRECEPDKPITMAIAVSGIEDLLHG